MKIPLEFKLRVVWTMWNYRVLLLLLRGTVALLALVPPSLGYFIFTKAPADQDIAITLFGTGVFVLVLCLPWSALGFGLYLAIRNTLGTLVLKSISKQGFSIEFLKQVVFDRSGPWMPAKDVIEYYEELTGTPRGEEPPPSFPSSLMEKLV
jgi:hypothetical protein